MNPEQKEILKTLQAIEFSAFEFNLYLDTHPNDQRALAEYSNLEREARRIQEVYSKNYSPLMAEDNVDLPCWKWAEDPWPWDIEY